MTWLLVLDTVEHIPPSDFQSPLIADQSGQVSTDLADSPAGDFLVLIRHTNLTPVADGETAQLNSLGASLEPPLAVLLHPGGGSSGPRINLDVCRDLASALSLQPRHVRNGLVPFSHGLRDARGQIGTLIKALEDAICQDEPAQVASTLARIFRAFAALRSLPDIHDDCSEDCVMQVLLDRAAALTAAIARNSVAYIRESLSEHLLVFVLNTEERGSVTLADWTALLEDSAPLVHRSNSQADLESAVEDWLRCGGLEREQDAKHVRGYLTRLHGLLPQAASSPPDSARSLARSVMRVVDLIVEIIEEA